MKYALNMSLVVCCISLILCVGCKTMPESSDSHNPMIGKWLNEEDEDQFIGRYIYEYLSNGEIWLYVFNKKSDIQEANHRRIGEYKIFKDIIEIKWYFEIPKTAKYEIRTKDEDNIILFPLDKNWKEIVYFRHND